MYIMQHQLFWQKPVMVLQRLGKILLLKSLPLSSPIVATSSLCTLCSKNRFGHLTKLQSNLHCYFSETFPRRKFSECSIGKESIKVPSTECNNSVTKNLSAVNMPGDSGDNLLYPPIEPFNSGFLEVSKVHKVYYEECGNKDGVPVVYIHGGPGGGISARDRRYFDPAAYRIVLFDQRGAGKSTPAFSLEENDTWSLVADIEKLREHLGIEKWVLFGGSWGSTLSLVYAETHIDRVLAMVLRGIFTLRKEELTWFYQEGASFLFPDSWEGYVAPIPEAERGDFITAYYKRLTGDNEEERLRCARAWSTWEMATSQLHVNQENLNRCEDDIFSLAFARIECHYFVNNGFFKTPNQVIDNAKIIYDSGIPVTIIQGRYDVVCPAKTAWELRKQLPNAEFHLIPDAGHSAKEVGITKKLVEACDKYKTLFK